MCTKCHGFRIFRAEAIDNLSPQHTCCTHFRNFHEVVFTDCPEEGQAWCEFIYVKACVYTGTDVFETVSQCVT